MNSNIFRNYTPLFMSEVATRATKSGALVKSFFKWSYVWPSALYLFQGSACGVNYGVSKQLLPTANQPKVQVCSEVPGSELCVFRFPLTSLKPLKSRRRKDWGVISLQVTWEFTAFIPGNHSPYNKPWYNWDKLTRRLCFQNENPSFPYQCPQAWIVGIKHLMEDGSCSKVK